MSKKPYSENKAPHEFYLLLSPLFGLKQFLNSEGIDIIREHYDVFTSKGVFIHIVTGIDGERIFYMCSYSKRDLEEFCTEWDLYGEAVLVTATLKSVLEA